MIDQNLNNDILNTKNSDNKVIMPFEKSDEEYYVESLGKVKCKPIYSFFKRLIDLISSLLGIVLLSPIFIIVSIIIKLTSKGPIFYKEERLGKNGKPFKLVKFRSMKVNAEAAGAQWSQGDNDPRITKFGRIMRKTRLDELPQLFNIFTGKMTLVGPRPEREVFYNEFEKYIHGFSERLKVKPGLTGLAQVSGGYDLKPEEKVLYDIEYIKKRSLWMDIKIILKTVLVVFTHNGAK